MTDDQIRAAVRDAIARHLGTLPGAVPSHVPPSPVSWATPADDGFGFDASVAQVSAPNAAVIASAPGGIAIAAGPGAVVQVHVSHATFAIPTASEGGQDGPCVTEPHASCNKCGFCQSFGH